VVLGTSKRAKESREKGVETRGKNVKKLTHPTHGSIQLGDFQGIVDAQNSNQTGGKRSEAYLGKIGRPGMQKLRAQGSMLGDN